MLKIMLHIVGWQDKQQYNIPGRLIYRTRVMLLPALLVGGRRVCGVVGSWL